MDNIIQLVKNNKMVQIALILVIGYFFMQYYNKENLENVESQPTITQPTITQPQAPSQLAPVLTQSEQYNQIDEIVAGKVALTTEDLLPKYDEANAFAQENPVSKLLQEQSFITSGFHMGINTIGGNSNKIQYLDLRSAPPIPKQELGPFNNSSYDTPMGAGRRFLDIGV
jgi:hypothetical protein